MMGEDERESFIWAGMAAVGLLGYGLASGLVCWPGWMPSPRVFLIMAGLI